MKFADLTWNKERLDKDTLIDVSACMISVLIRGRNAWHGTWVRHWFHNSHLFSDTRSAHLGAEPLRERGSVFYVHDRPALLFTGRHSRFAVFDGFGVEGKDVPFKQFHGLAQNLTRTPVGDYCTGIFPGVTMHEAHQQLRSGDNWRKRITDNDLRFGAVPPECTLAWGEETAFDQYDSYPQGSGYLLGWSRSTRQIDTSGLQAQEKAWQDMVDGLDGASALAAEVRVHGRRKDSKALSELFRDRFKDPDHPARTRQDLRQRFEKTISKAERTVERLQSEYEAAVNAVDDAQSALWDAEEFAKDPWASDTFADATTAAEIRAARERAQNADLLVTQAATLLETASAANAEAWDRLREAEQQLAQLHRL